MTLLAVPRDTVMSRGVELGGNLSAHYSGDLLVAVSEIHIAQNELPERWSVPNAISTRRRYAFGLQPLAHGVEAHSFNSHHPENASDQGHP